MLFLTAPMASAAEYMPPPLFAGPADVTVAPTKPTVPLNPIPPTSPLIQDVPEAAMPSPLAPENIAPVKQVQKRIIRPAPQNEPERDVEKPRLPLKLRPFEKSPPLPVPARTPTRGTPANDLDIPPTPPPGVKGDISLPPNVLDPREQPMPTPAVTAGPVVNSAPERTAPLVQQNPSAISEPSTSLEPDDLLSHPARTVDPVIHPDSTVLSKPVLAGDRNKNGDIKTAPPQTSSVLPDALASPPPPHRKKPAGRAQPILDGPGLRPMPRANTDQPQKKAAPIVPVQNIKKSLESLKEIPGAGNDASPASEKMAPSDSLTPNTAPTTPPKVSPEIQTLSPAPQESTPKPTPTISKKPIKSPSPTVKRITEQNPRVMIYSRDKESGEFRAAKESEHRVLFNKGTSTTFKTPKENELPPPDFIDDVMDKVKPMAPVSSKPSQPPAPPAKRTPPPAPTDEMSQILNGRLAPISEDDLNRAVITMSPESFGSKPADVKPAQPMRPLSNPSPEIRPEIMEMSTSAPAVDTPLSLPSTGNVQPKIIFAPGLTELTQPQRSQIDDSALSPLGRDATRHIEIRSYASTLNNEQSSDRRVALARGLAVRDYLKSQGITSDRIELKVLGAPIDKTPQDRVDLVVR